MNNWRMLLRATLNDDDFYRSCALAKCLAQNFRKGKTLVKSQNTKEKSTLEGKKSRSSKTSQKSFSLTTD